MPPLQFKKHYFLRLQSITLGILAAFCIAPSAHSQVTVSSWTGGGESSTDAFDVSRGTTVLSASAQNSGSDARSALGFSNVGFAEPGNTYFQDSRPAGTVDFINFRTTSAVTIIGFQLRTYDDSFSPGNSNRGMTRFSLFSSADGGGNYTLVATATLQNSYTSAYGSSGILVGASFAPVTSQDFRIEAVRFNTTAPRIVELDAVSAAPEPGSLTLAASAALLLPLVARKRFRAGVSKGSDQ